MGLCFKKMLQCAHYCRTSPRGNGNGAIAKPIEQIPIIFWYKMVYLKTYITNDKTLVHNT